MRFLRGPSRLGNIFIAISLVLLLAVPVTYAWTDLQGVILQAQLRNEAAAPVAGVVTRDPAPAASRSEPAVPPPAPTLPVIEAQAPSAVAPIGTEPLPTPTAGLSRATVATAAATAIPEVTTPMPTAAPLGPPVRIVFPDLHIDGQVSEMGWRTTKAGSEWLVPDNTAGWAITSAPLGMPGNVVLSGHNNIYGMVFRPISLAWPENARHAVNAATYSTDLLNGRLIELYAANGQRFDYRVTGFYRLHDSGVALEQRQANADYMQPTPDAELTLITCWPPWSNTYRLVVRAQMIADR